MSGPAASGADVRVFSAASLTFQSGGAWREVPLGAYAFLPGDGPLAGDLWFGPAIGADLAPGRYGWRAVLHEVGHALGLKQPDEPGRFGTLAAHLDSVEASVMSARSFPGAPVGPGLRTEPDGHAETFMRHDILALQHMYGADYSDRRNTVYAFDPYDRVVLRTIWDGGGIDTYDFSRHVRALAIDLTPGRWSTTGQEPQLNRADVLAHGAAPRHAEGSIHNAFLFRGDWRSGIENAIGGAGSDRIVGNLLANRLDGRAGNDTLVGGDGADHLIGMAGADHVAGGSGADRLEGGLGGDRLSGEDGNDLIDAGPEADLAFGGVGDDRLFGRDGDDTLAGDGGRDLLAGEAGNDAMHGGADNDVLYGLDGADRLFGNDGADQLYGGLGNDVLHGGPGNDTLSGAAGADLFLVTGLTGNDVITDFSPIGDDRIDATDPAAALAGAMLVSGGTLLRLPGGTVHLLGVTPGDLGADNFI